MATTLYITTLGSDENDGSIGSPFQTAQKAFDVAYDGTGDFILDFGAGEFGGISISPEYYITHRNWPSRISVRGQGSGSSSIGGILNQAYDYNAVGSITITSDKSVNLGDVNGRATFCVSVTPANISLTNCVAGNIYTNFTESNCGGDALNGGNVTLVGGTYGTINTSGQNASCNYFGYSLLGGSAGTVTLLAGIGGMPTHGTITSNKGTSCAGVESDGDTGTYYGSNGLPDPSYSGQSLNRRAVSVCVRNGQASNAYYDGCDQCNGTAQNFCDCGVHSYDNNGTCCNGQQFQWCDNICNSGNVNDYCNICGGPAIDDSKGCCETNLRDCDGICYGPIVEDCNGICGGPAIEDCSGICNGLASLGCDYICNSGLVNDYCGVCDGSAQNDCDCTGSGYDDLGTCCYNGTIGCDGICDSGKLQDDFGTCCYSGTIGCDGICDSVAGYDLFNVCNGICFDSNACGSDGSYGCQYTQTQGACCINDDADCAGYCAQVGFWNDPNNAYCSDEAKDALGYCCGTCEDSDACNEDSSGCLYTACDDTCTSAIKNLGCCPQASDVRAGVAYTCDGTSYTGTMTANTSGFNIGSLLRLPISI
jgi:hypothetical protein